MWSWGCIIAEMYTGYPLFPGENEQEQLACIMEIFGVPPKALIDKASRASLFFDSEGRPRHLVNSKGKKRRPGSRTLQQSMSRCQDELFLDFIARCLEWDPAKRLTPSQALEHPWITHVYPRSNSAKRISSRKKTLAPAPPPVSTSVPENFPETSNAGTSTVPLNTTGAASTPAQPMLPEIDPISPGVGSFGIGALGAYLAAQPTSANTQERTTTEMTSPLSGMAATTDSAVTSKEPDPLSTNSVSSGTTEQSAVAVTGSATSAPNEEGAPMVPPLPSALLGDDIEAVMALLKSFPEPGSAPHAEASSTSKQGSAKANDPAWEPHPAPPELSYPSSTGYAPVLTQL